MNTVQYKEQEEWFIKNHVTKFDEKDYQWFLSLDDKHLINIFTIDVYIYHHYGSYKKHYYYKPFGATIYIADNEIEGVGKILCGDIDVKYYGRRYNIMLNNMYGRKGLSVINIGEYVTGWCNENGIRRISRNIKEMDIETVEKVLNKIERYDEVVGKFTDNVKELFYADKTNHFCRKEI